MEHISKGFPEISSEYLKTTKFFDFDKEEIRSFSYQVVESAQNAREKAIKTWDEKRISKLFSNFYFEIHKEFNKNL